MNNKSELITTKVKKETLRDLRFIRAYTGETAVTIIARLVKAELERVKEEKKD